MAPSGLRGLLLALAVSTVTPQPPHTSSGGSVRCEFGDGAPPGGDRAAPGGGAADVISCQPPAKVGAVTVNVDVNATTSGRYLQASVLSFTDPPSGRALLAAPTKNRVVGRGVKLALLPLGADEGHPIATAQQYLEAAGQHGADLAILPELFNQPESAVNHSAHNSSVCPHPETLDGPTISWVAAIAKKHSMNVVAPMYAQPPSCLLPHK